MSNGFDLTDKNGDGVPDVFEHRKPLSEIFAEEGTVTQPSTASRDASNETPLAVLEIEVVQRPARRGEMYFDGYDGLVRIETVGISSSRTIVRRVISAPSFWKVVKT